MFRPRVVAGLCPATVQAQFRRREDATVPDQTLDPQRTAAHLQALGHVDEMLRRSYPGGVPLQAAHTCYVPADRLREGEHREWGHEAAALLEAHAPDEGALATALDISLPHGTYADVLRLLRERPVADLRIDFEDGYGRRTDADEDAAVDAAIAAVRAGPPPSYGLRVKALEGDLAARSLRTLDRWLTGSAAAGLEACIVTLPKVQAPEQVTVLVDVLDELETELGIPGTRVELQIETAAGVVDAGGRVAVPLLVRAGRGRVTALHFGTYDYTASLGLSPREQSLDAPVADAAKDLMQLSAAETGVAVSDGSSNLLPIGDRSDVYAAWRLHAHLVQRSMARGLWQGWDLHPGQLVSRWAAVVAFLRERIPEVEERLAGRRSAVADEPATVRMLEALLARADALGLRN